MKTMDPWSEWPKLTQNHDQLVRITTFLDGTYAIDLLRRELSPQYAEEFFKREPKASASERDFDEMCALFSAKVRTEIFALRGRQGAITGGRAVAHHPEEQLPSSEPVLYRPGDPVTVTSAFAATGVSGKYAVDPESFQPAQLKVQHYNF